MPKAKKEQLEELVSKDGSLVDRLYKCQSMIAKMCKEGRPPKMSVPVRWDDEDFYICQTVEDAINEIESKA